jgi:hypothetical protein
MCRLSAYLPADQGMTAKNALTRLAYHARDNRGSGDTRTLDQLRVDTLVETLTRASDNLHPHTSDSNSNSNDSSSDNTETPKDTRNSNHVGAPDRTETRYGGGTTHGMKSTDDASTSGTEDTSHSTATTSTADGTDDHADGAATGAGEVDRHGVGRKVLHSSNTGTNDTETVSAGTDDAGDSGKGADQRWFSENNVGEKDVAKREVTQRQIPEDSAGKWEVKEKDVAERQAGQGDRTRSRSSTRDPRVLITISASTLTGEDDQPGYLQGHGPIVASMARQVATTGTWRCAVVDDTHGTLLGLGISTYTPNYKPTERLRRHLFARDRACRIPGCNAPAELCDIDHCTPWPGGATCECSTECLCGNHHRMKHETGFTLTPSTNPQDPPGTLIWTTPAGHQYPCYPSVLQDPPTNIADGPGTPTSPNTSPTPPSVNTTNWTSTTGTTGESYTISTTGRTSTTGSTRETGTTSGTDSTPVPRAPGVLSTELHADECRACDQADTTITAESQLYFNPATANAGPTPMTSTTPSRHPRADDPNDDAFEYEKPDDEADGFSSRLRPSYINALFPALPAPRFGDPPPF